MASNKPQKQTLRAVELEQALVTDDGDILQPLKSVRDQYTRKAAELDEKAYGDNRTAIQRTAAHYRAMADRLQNIIGDDYALVADSELGRAEDDGGKIAG